MTRAAIYARISLDQTGQALGVARQEQDCRDLAAQLGWEVAGLYVDNDISATSGKRRPEYLRMLSDADAGQLDAIIAWHPDRLYRKATDLGELVEVCKRNNTQIATVRAGAIDLTTPTGRLIAGLLAQVATYEGEAKADRHKRSVRQRREAGDFPRARTRLYGYTHTGEVVELEAERLRWIAKEVTDGASLNGLVRELMAKDWPTTTGGVWSVAGLRKTLLNPKLAGYSTLRGEIMGAGSWTPVLDPETWETVRAILEPRARPTPPRVALLAGMIFCGACGTRMVTGSRTTKVKGVSRRTYRCDRTPGAGGCQKVSASAETVEEIVEGVAQKLLARPDVRRRLTELRAEPSGAKAAELAELELRVTELEDQLAEPGVPAQTILRAIDKAKERQAELLSAIAAAPTVALPPTSADWPQDLARRRALVSLVVARVDVDPATTPGLFDPERVRLTPR